MGLKGRISGLVNRTSVELKVGSFMVNWENCLLNGMATCELFTY